MMGLLTVDDYLIAIVAVPFMCTASAL